MEKIKLRILGISYSQSQSGAYALILIEHSGKRRLPIIIGSFEAQSIAIELENMKPTRPLTHDLFKIFVDTFRISIKEVIIYKFADGIFYAKLICNDGTNNFEIDSRTSDAVAISLRVRCPIYTYESILNAAGINIDDENPEASSPDDTIYKEKVSNKKNEDNEFSKLTLPELEELLNSAIEDEAYEKASKIRDEINRRKKGK
ncbi:MAG TPA: bifunctional nuclease family protein [Bacteroidales bacterium]|nr:bifunctional nuclease family protein [Bacteroidales bacterium]HPS18306.1 bifunctional nuclease family protein [Bacteroidales bacterium]